MNQHCLWYGGHRGSWSQTIVEWLTVDCTHHNLAEAIPPYTGAIVVVKADACHNVTELNATLRRLSWVLLVICSNEEGEFRTDLVRHPKIRTWLQTPAKGQAAAHRYFPWGWTPNDGFEPTANRELDWFFAGQVTHVRRRACVEAIKSLPDGLIIQTEGFAKGLPHSVYCDGMRAAKMVPCPSGPLTVDSFRVGEALELGAIPILDCVSPLGPYPSYWNLVFDSTLPPDLKTVRPSCTPLPFVHDWADAPRLIEEWVADWPARSLRVWEWWRWQKTVWNHSFEEDIKWLLTR